MSAIQIFIANVIDFQQLVWHVLKMYNWYMTYTFVIAVYQTFIFRQDGSWILKIEEHPTRCSSPKLFLTNS